MPWNAWISSMFPSAPVFRCLRCSSKWPSILLRAGGIFPKIWSKPKPKTSLSTNPIQRKNNLPQDINFKLRLMAFFRVKSSLSTPKQRLQGFLFFFQLPQGFPMVFRINSPAVWGGNSSFGLWKGLFKGLAPTSQPSAVVSRLGPWRSFPRFDGFFGVKIQWNSKHVEDKIRRDSQQSATPNTPRMIHNSHYPWPIVSLKNQRLARQDTEQIPPKHHSESSNSSIQKASKWHKLQLSLGRFSVWYNWILG